MSANPATSQATVMCLWCNGVLEWGAGAIEYDLCERCVPYVMTALNTRLAEAEPEPARSQPGWKRFFAAR